MANEVNYIDANTTYIVDFNFIDEDGDPIALAALGTFHLTNYYFNIDTKASDRYHLATINGRFQQNVKNANDVTVSASGSVQWILTPDDSPKLDSNTDVELHIALFQWWWDSGSANQELKFYVRKIPYAE